jgi:monoglucosyldiacylglycerol epimerase
LNSLSKFPIGLCSIVLAQVTGFSSIVDKSSRYEPHIFGTSRSLQAKVVGITGASGTLGQALIAELLLKGAKVIAFTTNRSAVFAPDIKVIAWQLGSEVELRSSLQELDILIVNHGVNVYADRSISAIQQSYEVNTFSALRLAELFIETISPATDNPTQTSSKEIWINTSEAEVNPAFSPLYELSKRTLGDLVTLLRLDSPCIIRKLVLGPFKSKLNPVGVMSPQWVAWAIITLATRDFRNIIVTINPLTYLLLPIKEFCQSRYFRLLTKKAEGELN